MTRANFPLMLIVFLTAFLGSSAVNVLQADTTYYVDAIAGDDSSQGTAEQPFKTYLPFVWTYGERNPDIGKITLQPGDEVVFAKEFIRRLIKHRLMSPGALTEAYTFVELQVRLQSLSSFVASLVP